MSKFGTFAKTTAFAIALGVSGWIAYDLTRPPYDGTAGITYGSASAPIRGTEVDFNIWYPATPGGKAITVGGNGVFYGTPAGRDAPHKTGRFPMVVISHGAGGNAGQFGWIAAELAQAGFVVVLPNHPGTTTGNASAQAAIRVWERPADVSAVLDEITANAVAYPYIDTSNISILGFSAGGYTAMAAAGARVDPDLLQRFCDDTDHGMSDCAFLAHFGVDLHDFDLSPAAQDLRDHRIKTAVIIDPGIVETMTEHSLEQIDIPMLIINLGEEETIPVGVYARAASELIPTARYAIVEDAIHFSFLAQCKPRGAKILIDEDELDPLCDDAGGRPRADIHNELSSAIVSYLKANI
ncbi:alpha/beta hydrolase family protein [Aliiroseovarius sp. 2305UL8-7]|uniref:alpha/beta hydrolase family protein n=1 Tax=Aliiroseovarius conchicola TaxID=3121637 RepID=UPI003527FFC4